MHGMIEIGAAHCQMEKLNNDNVKILAGVVSTVISLQVNLFTYIIH